MNNNIKNKNQMNDVKKLTKTKFIKDVIKNRRRKIDLKFFSASKHMNYNIDTSNLELNKLNIRELSTLSDRPIQKSENKNKNKKIKINETLKAKQLSNYNIDIRNIKFENNINLNNNYHYNNYIPNCHKSVVIFEEPPKKLSDYILKDKSIGKKKVYKLIFLEEKDDNRNKKHYVNYYTNTEGSQMFQNTSSNFFNYKKLKKYNDLYYNNNNSVDKRKKVTLNINTKTKPKNEQNRENIIKIQKLWRGFRIRNIYKKNLKIIFSSRIYRIISKKMYIIIKSYKKIFFAKLNKIFNNSSINTRKLENKKLNKNNKIYVNKNRNKANIKNPYNNYVYNKKNQSIGFNSSFNKRNTNNIQVHNLKPISKKINNNYNIYKRKNYKNEIEKEITHINKYVFKRNCFMHFPILLYRLKILQRLNLLEHRYNCLYNILKIRKKLILYQYFHKYKNIIDIESKNDKISLSGKKTLNNSLDKSNNGNIIKINLRKKILTNKNELNSPLKRSAMLNKIFKKIDSKNKKLLLKKYFDRWKNIISMKKVKFQNSINKLDSSYNINPTYKSTASVKKKQIRIKKLQTNYYNSKILSKSIGKNNITSYYSDNLSGKKMRVHKISVLCEPNEIKKEGIKKLNIIVKKNSSDNSYFISKIKNVANKINIKNYMSKCFKLWKKKSNLD